jgi:hypothetical protein
MRLASLTLGLFVLAAGALSACGSDRPRILDTERIERAIQDTILQKRHLRAQVSCPSGTEQRKGVVFTCIATYPRGQNPFVVTVDTDAGAVHYRGVGSAGQAR